MTGDRLLPEGIAESIGADTAGRDTARHNAIFNAALSGLRIGVPGITDRTRQAVARSIALKAGRALSELEELP